MHEGMYDGSYDRGSADVKLQEPRLSDFLKQHFIIAMPGLMDPNFSQTVTCICEHTSMGALGIVINRIHPFATAKEIFEELEIAYRPEKGSAPIYAGGPVHSGEIFILHGPPLHWEGSIPISSFLAMGNTKDLLCAIAAGKGPGSFMIALGCAGWGPGQLESEIKANAWLTGPLIEEIIFHTPVEMRWQEAVRKLGIDPAFLADTAGHA